jgi:hypothetical protein
MGLMSLFGTWQVQDKPLLATCQQLLLSPTPPKAPKSRLIPPTQITLTKSEL